MDIGDTEKIKLTLSGFCNDRLKTDCNIYGIVLSHLIEIVVCEYCNTAKQFGNVSANEKLTTINAIISGQKDILYFRTILRLLLDAPVHRGSQKGAVQHTWTVTIPARKALKKDTLSLKEPNSFISELLEEYATMNNASRERIVLSKKIEDLNDAINACAEISFFSRHDTKKIILPYKIVADPVSQYIYLIGQSVAENGPGEIGSFRIFSMNKISYTGKTFIPDKKAFEQYISGRNVAYLWKTETDIEIGLTKDGENNLGLLFNNRPAFKKTDEYLDCEKKFRIYKFTCTEFQAEVYFSSFGKEAKVISPASLVEKMKKFHSEALEVYSE